jgi:hypothetical protein
MKQIIKEEKMKKMREVNENWMKISKTPQTKS